MPGKFIEDYDHVPETKEDRQSFLCNQGQGFANMILGIS